MPATAFLALLPSLLVPALLVVYPTSVWPAIVLYHAYCLLASFMYEDPHDPRPLHARLTTLPTGPAIAAVVVLVLGEAVARGLIDVRGIVPASVAHVVQVATPWRVFAAYVLLANGYIEERFWRGALLRQTRVLPGAGAFALMHALAAGVLLGVLAGAFAGVAALLAGLFWGEVRLRYRSLWPCVLTHVAVDGALLRIAWSMSS